MKTKFLIVALIGVFLAGAQVQASGGDKGGNGGDPCEAQIYTIRNDIVSWIQRGGSAGLTLPKNVSLKRYNSKMLSALTNPTTKVSCTNDKVLVGDSEKACKNFETKSGAHILCNRKAFLKDANVEAQYFLTHHEYAGLAGLEVNSGDESRYAISNQISGFLADQVVKKLAIKPNSQTDENSSRPLKEVSCSVAMDITDHYRNSEKCFYKIKQKPQGGYEVSISGRNEWDDGGSDGRPTVGHGPTYHVELGDLPKCDISLANPNLFACGYNVSSEVKQTAFDEPSVKIETVMPQGFELKAKDLSDGQKEMLELCGGDEDSAPNGVFENYDGTENSIVKSIAFDMSLGIEPKCVVK